MIDNAPPSMHEGMTYAECLERLIAECEAYGGEPVDLDTGEYEDPLHKAVRLVESWQVNEYDDEDEHPGWRSWAKTKAWRVLPGAARSYWGDLLRACREGDVIEKRWGDCFRGKNFGEADPEKAVEAARELAEWARKEIEEKGSE